jgi:Secretion system C-terminal sorting domain
MDIKNTNDFQRLVAYQASFKYDKSRIKILEMEEAELKDTWERNFNIMADEVRAVWTSPKPIDLKSDLAIFRVKFMALEDMPTSTPIFSVNTDPESIPTEFYGETGEMLTVGFDAVIKSLPTAPHITIYPNPVNDRVNLRFFGEPSESRFEILSTEGKVVQSGTVNTGDLMQEVSIEISDDVPAGAYFLKVISEDKVSTISLIRQ